MALRKKGVLSVEGEGSARLISDYRQLRQAQTALTRELGLSPASRQAIRAHGTSAALDLAGLLAAAGRRGRCQPCFAGERCARRRIRASATAMSDESGS